MRWQAMVLAMGVLVGSAHAEDKRASAAASPAPEASGKAAGADLKSTGSYLLGYRLAAPVHQQLKVDPADLDLDQLAKGMRDAVTGAEPGVPHDQIEGIWHEFMGKLQSKQAEAGKAMGDKNKKEGEAFLAENKAKPGIVTLPSGLQYKVVKEGNGPSPKKTDTVSTNYRGTLIDGKEFDSSMRHGGPAEFPVGGVIAGWTEALQLMKVGSKWQLFVPSELAYGAHGQPPDIGPNATLLFEVELLAIK